MLKHILTSALAGAMMAGAVPSAFALTASSVDLNVDSFTTGTLQQDASTCGTYVGRERRICDVRLQNAANTDSATFDSNMNVNLSFDQNFKEACGDMMGDKLADCRLRYRAMWREAHNELQVWWKSLNGQFKASIMKGSTQQASTGYDWLRVDADGKLTVKAMGKNDFSSEPSNRWKDAQGNWFKMQGDQLMISIDSGATWRTSVDGRWKGADNKWYHFDDEGMLQVSTNGSSWVDATDDTWPGTAATTATTTKPTVGNNVNVQLRAQLRKDAWNACANRTPRTRSSCMQDYVNMHGE